MKKKWQIELSQNGWEYTGYVFITAVELVKIDSKSLMADGILIGFDECIGEIECLT